MSEAPCLIYDDPRAINGVYYPGDDGGCYVVGQSGTTRIVAYRDHGVSDFTPWIAVYKDADLVSRIPAHMVQIVYATPPIDQSRGEG